MKYITYTHCGVTWHDVWDSACDSECPVCGVAVEALQWEDLEPLAAEESRHEEKTNTGLPIEYAHECPACGSVDDVEGYSVEVEEDMATQRCGCNSCHAEWILGFTLSAVRML